MTKFASEYIQRWAKDNDAQMDSEKIIRAIQKGRRHIPAEKADDYFDLRGIPIQLAGDKALKIGKYRFEKFNFSFATISNTIWKNCTFINCRFEETRFKNVTFINCNFIDLTFSRCSFISCKMAENIGKHSGLFENVQFENCNITRCDFAFPIIRNCRFINNKFSEVEFDGSRFYSCRFVGEIEAAEFRGVSFSARTHWLGLIRWVDPRKHKNPMENVDFTEAEFRYVGFADGINLSNCLFKIDEDNFLIKNPRAVFSRVRAEIEHHWDHKDKKRALHQLDMFIFSKQQEGLPLVYFYKRPAVDTLKEFEEKLHNLVKKINSELIT